MSKFSQLIGLADVFITRAISETHDVREGTVMTIGPAPYRRLDCDGRALAYIRPRPKKHMVRIDISGLWVAHHHTPLRIASAASSATLAIRDLKDAYDAAAFLRVAIEATRQAHRRERERAMRPSTIRILRD